MLAFAFLELVSGHAYDGMAIRLALMLPAVPFVGILVRYRVGYRPKDEKVTIANMEYGECTLDSRPSLSYGAMAMEVYTTEGLTGFFKGTMPTMWFIINFVLTALTAVLVGLGLDMLRPAHLASSSNEFVYLSLQHFFFLPCTILIYRAMTTPYRLPWLDPQLARFVLLSNAERCSLLYVWLTPGLVEAQGLQVILLLLRWMARPELAGGDNQNATSIKRFTTDLALAIASTAILTPLEVIATRLMMQRKYWSSEVPQVPEGVEGMEYSTITPVVRFPNPERPYEGLVDAGKRIVHEEGWNMLYRAWWFTMLFH